MIFPPCFHNISIICPWYILWQFNIAKEHGPLVVDLPIKHFLIFPVREL